MGPDDIQKKLDQSHLRFLQIFFSARISLPFDLHSCSDQTKLFKFSDSESKTTHHLSFAPLIERSKQASMSNYEPVSAEVALREIGVQVNREAKFQFYDKEFWPGLISVFTVFILAVSGSSLGFVFSSWSAQAEQIQTSSR